MSCFETNPRCHLALPHIFVRFLFFFPLSDFKGRYDLFFLFFFSKAPRLRPIGKVPAPMEITSVASKPFMESPAECEISL